jgi:serine/threonine protein phosphatase PrpC
MMAIEAHSVGVHVSVAARTDIGKVRRNNEDAFLISDLSNGTRSDENPDIQRIVVGPKGVLLVVSDGIGGAKAGEVASALVVQGLARALEGGAANTPPSAQLKHAAANAHLDVTAAAHGRDRKGMGATLTAIYVMGRTAYVAEVGDSRAYLLRSGTLHRLTRDQSVAQALVDAGTLRPEDVERSPMKNVLAQAMGGESGIQVALGKLDLRDRDCLLLCSDGLSGALADEEIRTAILESPNLAAACEHLVAIANGRGGDDNITVIVAGVGGDLPAAPASERVSATYEILETFGRAAPSRKRDEPLVPAAVQVVR